MPKNNFKRINNVIGQLEGIKKMIDKKEKTFPIFVQFKAAKSALENAIIEFVENQMLNECAQKLSEKDKIKMRKILKEVLGS